MGVVGEFNQNLKELEKITNSSIYSRGNSILIKSNSEKNEILKRFGNVEKIWKFGKKLEIISKFGKERTWYKMSKFGF